MRPLRQRLQHRGINGNERSDRASLQESFRFNGDGRTDRASLHGNVGGCRTHYDSTLAVTAPCRDARSVRPLRQRLQHRGINGNERSDRASLQESFRFNGDGRTDRASLHGNVGGCRTHYDSTLAVTAPCRDARSVRPSPLRVTTFRPRSPDHSTTDAQTVRPLYNRLQRRGINGDGRSDRASLHGNVGG